MELSRRALVCAVALLTVGLLTARTSVEPAFASARALAPSIANAKRVTRNELLLMNQVLDQHLTHHPVTLTIGCKRVTAHLYRCSFLGEVSSDLWVYALTGKSKVRFSKRAARATLYDLTCKTWSLSDVSYDLCRG